jgi:hypothetical protein
MATHPPRQIHFEPVWTPCGYCWGQRCVFEYRARSVLVKTTCPRCLGVGDVLIIDAPAPLTPPPSRPGNRVLDDAVD